MSQDLSHSNADLANTDLVNTDLSNSVLVVAHPDDEALWFSSILEQVGTIVICFTEAPGQPQWTEGREAIKQHWPYSNTVFLDLTESMTVFGANWAQPVLTPFGLAIAPNEQTSSEFDSSRYEKNFTALGAALPKILQSADRVFTHNPWGEYGHEDHVLVYRAVEAHCKTNNVPLWFSGYVSNRSAALMTQTLVGPQWHYEQRDTHPELLAQLRTLYEQHNCWTWPFDDFQLPATETLIRDRLQDRLSWQPNLPGSRKSWRASGNAIPLNYIQVDDPPARPDWRTRLRFLFNG